MNAFLRPSQPWWQCNPYRSLLSSPPPCAIAESTKFVKLSSSSAHVLVSEVYRVSRSSSDRHNPPGRDGTGPDNWASIPKLDSRFDPPLSSSPEILYDEVLLVFLCSSLLARNSHSRRSCLLCLPSSALPPSPTSCRRRSTLGRRRRRRRNGTRAVLFFFRLKERPPSDRGWYGIQQRPRCKTPCLVFLLPYLTARYAVSGVMDPHQSQVALLHESLAKS